MSSFVKQTWPISSVIFSRFSGSTRLLSWWVIARTNDLQMTIIVRIASDLQYDITTNDCPFQSSAQQEHITIKLYRPVSNALRDITSH